MRPGPLPLACAAAGGGPAPTPATSAAAIASRAGCPSFHEMRGAEGVIRAIGRSVRGAEAVRQFTTAGLAAVGGRVYPEGGAVTVPPAMDMPRKSAEPSRSASSPDAPWRSPRSWRWSLIRRQGERKAGRYGHPHGGRASRRRRRRVERCEAAAAALADGRIGYTEALGLPRLRERIARHYAETYGIAVAPERIVVTTGSSAASSWPSWPLFEPGRRVAITAPGYPGLPQHPGGARHRGGPDRGRRRATDGP